MLHPILFGILRGAVTARIFLRIRQHAFTQCTGGNPPMHFGQATCLLAASTSDSVAGKNDASDSQRIHGFRQ